MEWIVLTLQIILATALAWSCFCRLVKTNNRTVREVRWAITYEAIAVMTLILAPFLPLLYPYYDWPPFTTPAFVWILLLAAAALIQIATARHWRDGQPPDFIQE